MKRIKTLLISTLGAFLIGAYPPSIHGFKSQDRQYFDYAVQEGPKATSSDFNFEIMNKASNPITVTVRNNDIDMAKKYEVKASTGDNPSDHGYLRISRLNLTVPTTLIVSVKDKERRRDYAYEIDSDGRTIFLTWDKNNFPRPQTGPWLGFLGKTESGLSLSNNVEKNQIVEEQAPLAP